MSTSASPAKTERSSHVLIDGGMGYELFRLGLPSDRKLGAWSALALVDPSFHNMVVEAHMNYLRSGAQVITTSNYSAVPIVLERMGRFDDWQSLTRTAVDLAVESRRQWYEEIAARRRAGNHKYIRNSHVDICGSLPPLNETYRPDLIYDEEFSIDFYHRLASILNEKCDILTAETMSGITEASYAVKGALLATEKLVTVSFTVMETGLLRDGHTLDEAVQELSAYPNVSGFGINCCTPSSILSALRKLKQETRDILESKGLTLCVYANGFVKNHGADSTLMQESYTALRDDLTPDAYLEFAKDCMNLGCDTVGGCCHVYPPHIAKINDFLIEHEHEHGNA